MAFQIENRFFLQDKAPVFRTELSQDGKDLAQLIPGVALVVWANRREREATLSSEKVLLVVRHVEILVFLRQEEEVS